MLLCVGACSGGGGGDAPAAPVVVSGIASAPGGQLARATGFGPLRMLAAFFIAEARAQVAGWSAVANANVYVFHIDDAGNPVGPTIATTTTDGSGAFSINLPPGTARVTWLIAQVSHLAGPVRVGTPNTLSVSLVQDSVRLDPATEAGMRWLIEQTAPPGDLSLASFSPSMIASYLNALEELVAFAPPPPGTLEEEIRGIDSLHKGRASLFFRVPFRDGEQPAPGFNWCPSVFEVTPIGQTGEPYHGRLIIFSGTPPYTVSLLRYSPPGTYDPTPPAPGLSFDAATGEISGIPTQAGDFLPLLKVSGADGCTGVYPQWIRITLGARPVASFTGPSSYIVDEFVGFVSTSVHPDPSRSIVQLAWDFGDGTPVVTSADTVRQHRYAATGVYTVRLRVTDDAGSFAETTRTITIALRPGPVALFDTTPTGALTNQPVSFVSTSFHPDARRRIVQYEWDLDGDGTFDATGATAARSYALPGVYTVRLRVTDDATPTPNTAETTYALQVIVPPAGGGSGTIEATSATPASGQGVIAVGAVTVDAFVVGGVTRTRVTVIGRTAAGGPATVQFVFDRDSGRNLDIVYRWDNSIVVYCTPGTTNPCRGASVTLRPDGTGDINLTDVFLLAGANDSAQLNGSVQFSSSGVQPPPPAVPTLSVAPNVITVARSGTGGATVTGTFPAAWSAPLNLSIVGIEAIVYPDGSGLRCASESFGSAFLSPLTLSTTLGIQVSGSLNGVSCPVGSHGLEVRGTTSQGQAFSTRFTLTIQ